MFTFYIFVNGQKLIRRSPQWTNESNDVCFLGFWCCVVGFGCYFVVVVITPITEGKKDLDVKYICFKAV